MTVQELTENEKYKFWYFKIKECKESGLPVKTWCKQNNVCEQTYYKWLKKLRTMAVESGDYYSVADQ